MSNKYENTYATKNVASSEDPKNSYNDSLSYRSTIAPRQLIIQRGSNANQSLTRSKFGGSENFLQPSFFAPSGAYASITTSGIQTVASSREEEKKDMQDLNDRFANYIEKVRFLEVQNRKLTDELEKLKAKWGMETTQIKAMYLTELDEARRMLDEAEKEKAYLSIRVASLEEQLEESRKKNGEAFNEIDELKQRVEQLNAALNKAEADVGPLRRRTDVLEGEKLKDKQTIDELRANLDNTRINLDNQTLLHVDAENRRQTLEEDISFLKQIHEQELKELSALVCRDTTPENREFWKNEMGQALREIREIYDDKIDGMRADLESYYNLKLQEFTTKATKGGMETEHMKNEVKKLRDMVSELRNKNGDLENKYLAMQRQCSNLTMEKEERERILEEENKNLKMEMAKLRAEMEAILKELQVIINTKLGLELEIAAYRKLLEGEENRIGIRQFVDETMSGKGKYTLSESYSATDGNQFTHKMSVREPVIFRKKNVSLELVDVASDGSYAEIENTGYKNFSLAGHKISRSVNGKNSAEYDFAKKASIQAGDKIKIWAKNEKPLSAPYNDIEASFKSWGIGNNSYTKLIDNIGEEIMGIRTDE